jgi:hypothetical protein
LFQGDLRLGTVDDVVGDRGVAATVAVGIPGLFREKQVGIDPGLELSVEIGQRDGGDAAAPPWPPRSRRREPSPTPAESLWGSWFPDGASRGTRRAAPRAHALHRPA